MCPREYLRCSMRIVRNICNIKNYSVWYFTVMMVNTIQRYCLPRNATEYETAKDRKKIKSQGE